MTAAGLIVYPSMAPATGGLDWHWELRTLRSFNYDGPITIDVAGDRRWLLGSANLIRELWLEAA